MLQSCSVFDFSIAIFNCRKYLPRVERWNSSFRKNGSLRTGDIANSQIGDIWQISDILGGSKYLNGLKEIDYEIDTLLYVSIL